MVVAGYLRGKEETAHVDDNTLHLKQQQAAIQPYTRVTLLEERVTLQSGHFKKGNSGIRGGGSKEGSVG